jgi:serine/threonine protein kinase
MKDEGPPNTFLSNGNYRIISTLGAGGMGTVLLAEDLKLKRKVAIKVLKEDISSDKHALTRTKLEGLILARLRHPSLASVYEMDMTDKNPYIVQEYIDGKSIKELINSKHLFNKNEALRLFREQADVLSYLHSQKIYHRDIKPENIMIDRSGKSVLMDFGLALSDDRTRFTRDDAFVGTFIYCAPEVLQGGDGGAQADVFQLGLVVYEAITGHSIYGNFKTVDEFLKLLFARKWEDAPLDPAIPKQVGTLIREACQFNPEDRPSSGRELLALINSGTSRSDRSSGKTFRPENTKDEQTNHENNSKTRDSKGVIRKGTGDSRTNDLTSGSKVISGKRGVSKARGRKAIGDTTSGGKVIQSDETTFPSSSKRRIVILLFVFLLILLFSGYFLYSGSLFSNLNEFSEDNGGTAADRKDLFQSARIFFLTPQGFCIFLPSSAGKELHWTLKFTDPAKNEKDAPYGKFEKIAGGWKANLQLKEIASKSDATLSIFDGHTLIASKAVQFPDSLLQVPLNAVFSYDKVHVSWKLHGKAPAVLVVRGFKKEADEEETSIFTKKTDKSECILLPEEFGEGKVITISLHIPALSLQDIEVSTESDATKIGEVSGARELSLKFELPGGIPGEKKKFLPRLLGIGRTPETKIKAMAAFKDRFYLITRSGDVYGMMILPDKDGMFKILWKHALREIPAFANIPAATNEDCPLSVFPDSLSATESGLTCFGLRRGLKIHSYDINGKHSESLTPFVPLEGQDPSKNASRNLLDVKILDSKILYIWRVNGKRQMTLSSKKDEVSKENEVSKAVIIHENQGPLIKAFSGLNTTFLVLEEKGNNVLYNLKENPADYRLEEIARFPVSEFVKQNCSADFCENINVGLVSVNSDLRYLYPKGDGFYCKRIVTNLTDKSFLRSTLRIEPGKFISLITSGDSTSYSSNTVMNLKILTTSFSDSREVTTVLRTLSENIVVGLNQCNVKEPVLIDENRFCFCAGMGFFIMSTNNLQRLYRKEFFEDPDKLIVTNEYILTSKYSQGAIFGLPLLRD